METPTNNEHDQFMYESTTNSSVVVKVGSERALTRNFKPVFSFEYDTISFSTSTKEYNLGGQTHGLNETQVAEVVAFLNTVEENPLISDALKLNRDSMGYLTATDWYVVRFAETGTPVPTEVTAQRQASREAIVDVETLLP